MKKKEITRRPDFAGGGVTEEELAAMHKHAELWIQRAMRTTPIEPDKIVPAIQSLYHAAGLALPRIIIVPSPLVMAFAGGIAATWWKHRDATDNAIRTATRIAIYNAISDAISDATHNAIYTAISDATHNAIYTAISDATHNATRTAISDATHNAISDAIYNATHTATRTAISDAIYTATHTAISDAIYNAISDAIYNAISDATEKSRVFNYATAFLGANLTQKAMDEIRNWAHHYQGGNMWAEWVCFQTAFRDIIGLRLPIFEKLAVWEQCAINGGFRFMHAKFCIVSDFPETLRVDAQHRPHAEFGPSHRWRDGWALHHLHGIRVPAWLAEDHPDSLDARRILQIQNVDQRREGIRRLGSERLVSQLEPSLLDKQDTYELLAVKIEADQEPWKYLKMQNPSIDAVHIEAVPPECRTVEHAINWRRYRRLDQQWKPSQLT